MVNIFEIIDEVVRQYIKFNAGGTQLKVRLLSTSDNEIVTDPVTHFKTSMKALFVNALRSFDE
jgi:hypothetical protein